MKRARGSQSTWPLVALGGLVLGGCAQAQQDRSATGPDPEPLERAGEEEVLEVATVELAPRSGSDVRGTLTFTQREDGLFLSGTIHNLQPGTTHGMHVHEFGDCSAPDASSAGDHYAPLGGRHGPPGPGSHLGDFGNITADENGVATFEMEVPGGTLTPGVTSLRGRAVVVHEQRDDLRTQPSGDSGGRIACGVIPEQRRPQAS